MFVTVKMILPYNAKIRLSCPLLDHQPLLSCILVHNLMKNNATQSSILTIINKHQYTNINLFKPIGLQLNQCINYHSELTSIIKYIEQYNQVIMESSNTVTLPYIIPDLRKATSFLAGRRPYREGGVRMQKTKEENGKIVYHDYGHGGAGISIAYGCSLHVIETLFLPQNVNKNEEIAILGAGVIGLTTAYLLTQRGYKVNLYAELTPFEKIKDKPDITSTVAAGYWMPLKVGNKAQTVAFATKTWNHYQDIRLLQQKTGRKFGITKMPTYVLNDDSQTYHFKIEGVIQPKDCMVTFGDRIYYKSKTFPTFVIETTLYCNFLREQLQKTGNYKLINANFKSKNDFLSLKEKHIFNCFGLGSKQIFGDQNLRGIKGHIIKFKLSEHQKVKDFILVMKTIDGGLLLQVPQPQTGYFNIGVSFQQGKSNSFVEMSGINFVFDQARNFYLQVDANKITPKL